MAREIRFTVTLNGTDTNPYARFGLKQNPFPQIAEAEYAPHVLHLQALAGDPIPDEGYIRRHLRGWPVEFVNAICSRYVKGETVSFEVFFPADAPRMEGPVQE